MSRQEIENEEEGEIVDTDAPQSRLDAGVIGADEISSDSDHFYELPSPTPSRATGLFNVCQVLSCYFFKVIGVVNHAQCSDTIQWGTEYWNHLNTRQI
jgi:hypothetical protein